MHLAVAGATGRIGRRIVEQALLRGHIVRALAREEIPDPRPAGLTWVIGTIDDMTTLERLIDGSEAVISAIGPRPDRYNVCSVATANLIKAGPPRLLVVSGMGVTIAGDRKSLLDRAASGVVQIVAPAVFADKMTEMSLLQRSSTAWTAIRVGAVTERGEAQSVKADPHRPLGFAINLASLAAFCVKEAERAEFIRQAPFVSF